MSVQSEIDRINGAKSQIKMAIEDKGVSIAEGSSIGEYAVKISEIKTGTTLPELGITASADEINYVKGVTSGIQGQIDGKSGINHTHSNATASEDGFMSAADKAKLDGISFATDTDFKAYMGIS